MKLSVQFYYLCSVDGSRESVEYHLTTKNPCAQVISEALARLKRLRVDPADCKRAGTFLKETANLERLQRQQRGEIEYDEPLLLNFPSGTISLSRVAILTCGTAEIGEARVEGKVRTGDSERDRQLGFVVCASLDKRGGRDSRAYDALSIVSQLAVMSGMTTEEARTVASQAFKRRARHGMAQTPEKALAQAVDALLVLADQAGISRKTQQAMHQRFLKEPAFGYPTLNIRTKL